MEQRQVMGEWARIQNGEALGLRWVLLSAWHVADTQKRLDCLVSLLLVSMVGLGVWEFPQSMQYSPCMSTFENFSRRGVFDFTRFC